MHKQEYFQTNCSNHMSSDTSKESSICVMNVVASAMKNATKSTGYISYVMSRLLGNKCHFAIVFCPFYLLYNLVKMPKRSNWVYSIQAVVMNKEIKFALKRNIYLFIYTALYSFFLIQTSFLVIFFSESIQTKAGITTIYLRLTLCKKKHPLVSEMTEIYLHNTL